MPAASKPNARAARDGFIQQIEAAEKVLSFAKLILCAFAAILLWAARLQWNVADLQRQVTETNAKVVEIQEDRRAHIKDAEAWRHDVEIANVKRDEAIARLANAQTIQAAGAEGARAARSR